MFIKFPKLKFDICVILAVISSKVSKNTIISPTEQRPQPSRQVAMAITSPGAPQGEFFHAGNGQMADPY